MTVNHVALLYLVASVLFILALKGLSSPETARRGNLFGIAGMLIAVFTTLALTRSVATIVAAVAVGGTVGAVVARRVQMTQMPELVAIMHSLVGLAACLVGFASYVDTSIQFTGAEKAVHEIEIYLGILIGAVTFSGSVIAFGKLSGRIGGKPLLLPARHWINLAGLLATLWCGWLFVQAPTIQAGQPLRMVRSKKAGV